MGADLGPDSQSLWGWHSSETRRRGGLGIWGLDRRSEGNLSLEEHLTLFVEHPVQFWRPRTQGSSRRI